MKLTCADRDCERAPMRTRDGQRWCMWHPTEAAPPMDMMTGKLRGPDGKEKKHAAPKAGYRETGRVEVPDVEDVELPDDDVDEGEPGLEPAAAASPVPRARPPARAAEPNPAEVQGATGWRTPRPSPPPAAACGHVTDLPTRVLVEHPGNVRTDLGDLDELQQSVREQGLLQPLLVTRMPDGVYVVIGGHRRLAVAVRLDLPRVPVMVRQQFVEDVAAVEAMLVENLQRAALDPLDEAAGYQQLLDAGRTQAEIAKRVGKAQGHVSQRLALLNLTPAEQEALRRREITVQAGYRAGRARSSNAMRAGQRRPKPKRVPHFTKQHPLSAAAAARCQHETTLKLGVACGPCWEATIRADAAGAA